MTHPTPDSQITHGAMTVVECALCGETIRSNEPRWIATTDRVCLDCIRTLVDDELNRRVDGQPSSITKILAGDLDA